MEVIGNLPCAGKHPLCMVFSFVALSAWGFFFLESKIDLQPRQDRRFQVRGCFRVDSVGTSPVDMTSFVPDKRSLFLSMSTFLLSFPCSLLVPLISILSLFQFQLRTSTIPTLTRSHYSTAAVHFIYNWIDILVSRFHLGADKPTKGAASPPPPPGAFRVSNPLSSLSSDLISILLGNFPLNLCFIFFLNLFKIE